MSDIRRENDGLVYIRPVFDSQKLFCIGTTGGDPVLLSILPGQFEENAAAREPGEIKFSTVDPPLPDQIGIRHLGIRKMQMENQALKAADVVVSAGRGIGSKENIDVVEQFCRYLPKSALGASRPLVDQGWIGYGHQVGITGASVSPDLYLACGISGSSQHIAGMQGAKKVVAVNSNPDAPIFRHADICIVADAIPFLGEVMRILNKEGDSTE